VPTRSRASGKSSASSRRVATTWTRPGLSLDLVSLSAWNAPSPNWQALTGPNCPQLEKRAGLTYQPGMFGTAMAVSPASLMKRRNGSVAVARLSCVKSPFIKCFVLVASYECPPVVIKQGQVCVTLAAGGVGRGRPKPARLPSHGCGCSVIVSSMKVPVATLHRWSADRGTRRECQSSPPTNSHPAWSCPE
jgi:hypothetical protein